MNSRIIFEGKTKKILIKILILILVIAIVYILFTLMLKIFSLDDQKKELTYEEKLKKKSDTSVFVGEIPEQDKQIFSDLIDNYYKACNEKRYEDAYALLSNECKSKMFPTVESFKEDVDEKFDKLKLYEYQNFSNADEMYVYQLYLFDDVSSYGTNESPEKNIYYIAIIKDVEGNPKLNLNGYLKTQVLSYKYSQNNIEIYIKRKEIYYDHVEFVMDVKNNNTNLDMIFRFDNAHYTISNKNKDVMYKNTKRVLNFLFVNMNDEKEITLSFEKSFDSTSYKDDKIEIIDMCLLDAKIFDDLIDNRINIYRIKDYVNNFTNITLSL